MFGYTWFCRDFITWTSWSLTEEYTQQRKAELVYRHESYGADSSLCKYVHIIYGLSW